MDKRTFEKTSYRVAVEKKHDTCSYGCKDGCNNPAILRMYRELNPGWVEDNGAGEFVRLESYTTCAQCQGYPKEMVAEKNMLTVKDVCDLLHIHVNTARRWSDQGIIKSHRITRRGDRRFRREDILKYLESVNQFSTAA
jgi:excisionase family DNA binding protein